MKTKILFLDYDGVLHPDEAYIVRGRPVLMADGALFMRAPLLVDLLQSAPHVRIVLSTSWVRVFSYSRARNKLPLAIQNRVMGATWHSAMKQAPDINQYRLTWWDRAIRYQQIHRYVVRAGLEDWVAVDDEPIGWAAEHEDKLVQVDGSTGLSDPLVLQKLAAHFW